MQMRLLKLLAYLWASPNTLLGLIIVFVAVCTGGQARIVRGVVEVHGGFATRLLSGWVLWIRHAAAMTLGHVILGRNQECLNHSRDHEHVHVRQYERWGPLMLPAYLGSSLLLYFRGLDPYLDNPFEQEAYNQTS